MTEQEWKDEDAALERDAIRREELEMQDIIIDAANGWAHALGLKEQA